MQAWRARTFHLTRNKAFLAWCVSVILGAGVLTSLGVHAFTSKRSEEEMVASIVSEQEQLVESCRRLMNATTPDPAKLAQWLRASSKTFLEEPQDLPFNAAELRLGRLELGPLVDKHAPLGSNGVFKAFIRCRFMEDSPERAEARSYLEKITGEQKSPPFAQEFMGDILFLEARYGDALKAYLKESPLPGAAHSRDYGLMVALELNDAAAARVLCNNPRVRQEAAPEHLWKAAQLADNKPLLLESLVKMQLQYWQLSGSLAFALLAAVVWYVILVHSASAEKWRYLRYIPAVLAGIISVWLLRWAQGTMGYASQPEEQASMAQELLHWILYVGVPEETAKFICFLPFVPWLLHEKSGVKAALMAGCVGLGFALEENLGYFAELGPAIATGRLLTANFMHISLTGVLGWYVWDLFRSRFHSATTFLTAFASIAAVHGAYDFTAGARSSDMGLGIAGIIILALTARFYLQMLYPAHVIRHRMTVSSTSMFLIGSSLLTGFLMVVLVYQEESLLGITAMLKQALGLATVALIYVREFKEL